MSNRGQSERTWPCFRFGLLVTGKAEEKHAPKLLPRGIRRHSSLTDHPSPVPSLRQ